MDSSDSESSPPEKLNCGSERKLSDVLKKLRVDRDNDDTNSDSGSDLSDSEYVCSVCSKKFSGFVPFQQHKKGSKHAKALLKKKREKKLLEKVTVAEKMTENDEEYLLLIKKPYAICKPCGKQFGSPESYASHMESKVHKQKALQASILDQVRENGEINVDMLKELYKSKMTADDSAEDLLEDTQGRIASFKEKGEDEYFAERGEEFECKDCKKTFSGLIPYTQHIMSKVHAKVIERKKLLQNIAPEDVQLATKSKVRDFSHLVVEDDILVCKLCSVAFSGPENAMQHLKSKSHSKNLEKYLRKQEKKQTAASRSAKLVENSSGVPSLPDTEDLLNVTGPTKSKTCSQNTASAKPEKSSEDDRQQISSTVFQHRDESPSSVSSEPRLHSLLSSTSSSSDDEDQQKSNATRNKEASSKTVVLVKGKLAPSSLPLHDDDHLKATGSVNKADSPKAHFYTGKEDSSSSSSSSSSDEDNPPNVTQLRKEKDAAESKIIKSVQKQNLSSKVAVNEKNAKKLASEMKKLEFRKKTEEPQSSNNRNESLYSYEKYKKYKDVMKLASKDDDDA